MGMTDEQPDGNYYGDDWRPVWAREVRTPEELAAAITAAFEACGTEEGHKLADQLLLRYIGSPEVSRAFNGETRWYA